MQSQKKFSFLELSIVALVILFIATKIWPDFHRNARNMAQADVIEPSQAFIGHQAVSSRRNVTCEVTPFAAKGSKQLTDKMLKDGNIDATLASGTKSGYNFSTVICRSDATGQVLARGWGTEPTAPGQTGQRYFCSDESGAIKYDNESVAHCMMYGESL